MNIEFTPQEAQFLFENIAQLNVPLKDPNAPQVAALGNACLLKIKAAIDESQPVDATGGGEGGGDILNLDEIADKASV